MIAESAHVFYLLCRVPNAKPGRDSFKYEIYGMEGIPQGEEGNVDGSVGDAAAALPHATP
jgi:hypothetical protein